MKLTKKTIISNISKGSVLKLKDSQEILDSFLSIIKKNSVNKTIKISNFGSFYYKNTPKRIGRNPITGISYVIKPFKRFIFKPSHRLKNNLN